MLSDGRKSASAAALMEGLCAEIVTAGVPIDRMMMAIRTIHPEILANTYGWKRQAPAIFEVNRVRRDVVNDPDYQRSPIKRIHDGEDELRWRLTDCAEVNAYDVLSDLQQDGYTDYVIFALPFSDGQRNTLSFATQATDGFSEDDLVLLRSMLPVLTLLIEVRASRMMSARLLDTYVGHEAGERILQGQVVRGEGQHIHAVIWYADLRDFTSLSDTRPMKEVIAILDDWFEAMTRAIHDHGGQVLKFIGDGLLAIFPLGDAAFRHYTCRQALQAAVEAQAAVKRLNATRAKHGKTELNYRLALHVGDLMWGNIGAVDRLDFTAIGPSVNLTARLEALCGELSVHLLMSGAFAAIAQESFDIVSLGRTSAARGRRASGSLYPPGRTRGPHGGGNGDRDRLTGGLRSAPPPSSSRGSRGPWFQGRGSRNPAPRPPAPT